ncbi:TPA: zonular occludens toxin domain-containing protein, partial [Pseudomonas aeruginosa]
DWKQTVTCAGRQAGAVASIAPAAPVAASADAPARGQSPLTIVPDSEYASRPWRHK